MSSSIARRVAVLEQRQQAGAVAPERVRKLAVKLFNASAFVAARLGAPHRLTTHEQAVEEAKRLLVADPEWDRRPVSSELKALLDQARRNMLGDRGEDFRPGDR